MSQLITQISPHIHDKTSTQKIMLDVVIALMPASIAGIFLFGLRALLVELLCVVASVVFEWAFEKICKRPNTIGDLSAVVTGLLLALNLPVDIEAWQAVFGCAVAIIVTKQLFGGIGKNFANPALTARIVMLMSFSATMSRWTIPNGVDATTTATPLAILINNAEGELPSLWHMFIGLRGGCIGETCALALIAGGVYLIARKVISWHTPVAYLLTVAVFALILKQNVFYHLLSGGLLIGSIFMATDYATTPCTKWGKVIFGIGCGFLTVVIRMWSIYPEGVSFAILLMNILTPFIERATLSRPFGGDKA